MMSRQKNKICIFATVLALAGCQGAYKTHTGAPQPVLDERVLEEKPLRIEAIPQGGIIMKRSYDPSWEMPKRDVDILREQFANLQNELLNMHSGQEQKMLSKFQDVENRVAKMRREEMRKAAEDAELMALVKAKFDTVDKNLEFLKASEAQQISEKDALLAVLDNKFDAVDNRLIELNKKDDFNNQANQEEIRLALQELSTLKADKDILIRALDKKFNEVESYTELLSEGLKGVEYEQDVQNRLAVARKQAMEEAREMRLLEELEMRKSIEGERREQLALVIEQAERQKLANEREDIARAKRQAEIEFKLASMKKELDILEMQEARRLSEADIRAQSMKESLEIRLGAVRELYDTKFATLEKEKAQLNQKLTELGESAVNKLKQQRESIEKRLEKISRQQESQYLAQLDALEGDKLLLEKKLVDIQSSSQAQIKKELKDQKEKLEKKIAELASSHEKALESNKDYQEQVASLKQDKVSLEEKLSKIDASTVSALQEQREALEETIAELQNQQELALEEAADYRDAIEERIFAMESQKDKPVSNEALESTGSRVGRVIESNAKLGGIHLSAADKGGIIGGYPQEDWVDLEDYQVVMHENNNELENILNDLLLRAEPYVGPWDVKWKLKSEHMDVLKERFSLDVETDFDSFTSYLSNYMKSYRGFGLTFNIFRKERILVVTDS